MVTDSHVCWLSDHSAVSVAIVGAKAANIARAAAHGLATVPGFVITTSGVSAGLDDAGLLADLRDAFDALVGEDAVPVVVRSSSTIEDAGSSSMAGRFTSVLDVVGWDALLEAAATVIRSADRVADEIGTKRPLAVLVQRQIATRLGGVLFGVDPVTGNRNELVVEAVPSGPDALVGGTALGDHYVLSRRGRIKQCTRHGATPPLGRGLRRSLAQLAAGADHLFGAPQDVEWCLDGDDRLWMLQSRPVTAVASKADGHSVLLGPGPVAETFPTPLRRLEADLWIPPFREGIVRALVTTGAGSAHTIRRSPVITAVHGWAAVDLELIGLTNGHTTLRRRMNPLVIARRLATAWRVGRLRVAMPALAHAIVATVDLDLAATPALEELSVDELVDTLERAGRELATVHAHEVLAGMLLRDQPAGTAAALALHALNDARAAGWTDEQILARLPIVLCFSPPSLDGARPLPRDAPGHRANPGTVDDLDSREALRLRARWLQELEPRAATELGSRLTKEGLLANESLLGELGLVELVAMAAGGPPPSDLAQRPTRRVEPPLPAAFRLAPTGDVRAAGTTTSRRRSAAARGLPAGGGRAVGVVQHVDNETSDADTILVTRHLEPQLAPRLGKLTGLVSETGSALSHLAILAREIGVPTVVGVSDALQRFPPGTKLLIDGSTGEIEHLGTIADVANAGVAP